MKTEEKQSADRPIHSQEFVVTTCDLSLQEAAEAIDEKAVLRSEIWHAGRPLGIGFPFRWVLERTEQGVRVRKIGVDADEVISDAVKEFSLEELTPKGTIELPDWDNNGRGVRLHIYPVRELQNLKVEGEGQWSPQVIAAEPLADMDQQREFRWSGTGVSLIAFAVAMGLCFWNPPKPETSELIPPQFAKLLLSPALKSELGENSRASTRKPGPGYNVVQAFQSEGIQKNTRSLFDMNAAKSLLQKSTLSDATSTGAAISKVFTGKSSLLQQKKLQARSTEPQIRQLTVLDKSGRNGLNPGYGNADGPSVVGQGTAMISMPTAGIGVDDGLTKDEVGKVIREHLSEIRYCYETAMVRTPGFEGKLVVAFSIAGSGSVKIASAKEASGEAGLDKCILNHLPKWKFPKPRGGVDVGVTYPFVFKSLGN